MLADVRDALRQFRKAPGFTATVVITLALGIGATTAIFTLVHQVMLKSLPVTKPEELWKIGDKSRCCNWGGYTQGDDGDFSLFSWEAYKNFRDHTPEFTDLAALQAGNDPLGVRRGGSQAPVDTRNGQYVSGNFFRTLGVQPWLGRLMTDADDRQEAPLVAVMSYRVWESKYGSDPSVVGENFQINGHAFTVIGVTPPGFYGAKLAGWGMPDFWLPITSEFVLATDVARPRRLTKTIWICWAGSARALAPPALEAKLRAEFHSWLASHLSDMEPGEKQLWQQQTLHLVPGGAGVAAMRDEYQDGLKLLLIAAGCVLLVACGNLANLMLARGLKNRAQISVRVALGASRLRLMRRALVESVLLAVIGGAFGIAVAYGGTRLILYLAFQIGGSKRLCSGEPGSIYTRAPIYAGHFDTDGDDIRNRTRVDDFARRSGRSAARGEPFSRRTPLVGAEVAGERTGGDVAGAAVGCGVAGTKPAEPGTPGFRFRNAVALYCVDQSDAWQRQARADGASVSADRRQAEGDSGNTNGLARALCADDRR